MKLLKLFVAWSFCGNLANYVAQGVVATLTDWFGFWPSCVGALFLWYWVLTALLSTEPYDSWSGLRPATKPKR